MAKESEELAFPATGGQDNLRTVYQALMASRIDFTTRIWETLKVGAMLDTATLAGFGGLFASDKIVATLYPYVGIGLIVMAFFIPAWVLKNVRREQALLFDDEFSMYQIEKVWGLHASIPQALRWKQDAPFMFVKKHLSPEYKCSTVAEPRDDGAVRWREGRIASQEFLKDILLGYGVILFAPLFLVGCIVLWIGIR